MTDAERFEEFFQRNYEKAMLEASRKGLKSLEVDFAVLDRDFPDLADRLLEKPEEVLQEAQKALVGMTLPEGTTALVARFRNLPKSLDIRIRSLRAEHIGKMIVIDGVVRRASEVKPEIARATFQCAYCGNKMVVNPSERVLTPPSVCDNPECGLRGKIEQISKELYDSRWVTLEEPFEVVTAERPGEITVYLKNDLTSPDMQRKTDPGTRLLITGVVKEIRKVFKGKMKTQLEIYVEANHVEPKEIEWEEVDISEENVARIKGMAADPLIYDRLRNSLAPSIYGLDEVKEAIVLQLFSGVQHTQPDHTKIRGDIHILLLGDPSTAKSQLLKLASKVIPRGRYASGGGVTGAGLTATVYKDEKFSGEWVLEAGALILANRGIMCLHPDTNVIIDDKIRRIGSLFDGKVKLGRMGNSIFEYNDVNLKVNSFDTASMSTAVTDAIHVRKKEWEGEMLDIALDSGFSLRLTPDHMLLDGNTMKWKEAGTFSEGDFIVSPLKIARVCDDEVYLLDILPDGWKVCLSQEEKNEIKGHIQGKLSDFNRKHGLGRHILSGGNQPSIKEFRGMLKSLGLYDAWKRRNFSYGRKHRGERFAVSKLTPELGYMLGFILGGGYVKVSDKKSQIVIVQSLKHDKYIKRLTECWKAVYGSSPRTYKMHSESVIRGKKVTSECISIHKTSNIAAFLLQCIIGKDLEGVLRLPDEVLKAFIGGVMDSDGRISIKNSTKSGRKYKVVHVEILLSNNKQLNLNFMLALRRLDCYSRIVDGKGVKIIRITGRDDVSLFKKGIEKYSEKIREELPDRMNTVSSASDKLPAALVSDLCNDMDGLSRTLLLKKGLWSTFHGYKNRTIQPSRQQLQKISALLEGSIDADANGRIDAMCRRDFFIDRIKSIEKTDYDGFVFDLFVPKNHNFVADGVFVHNCIDEFDKIDKADLSRLHEALEQQTVSIAKAAIVATLPAQTSVLAGANPKFSRFDAFKPVAQQIDIPDTLLSRFDLKFALRDVPNRERDEKLATHVLTSRLNPSKIEPEIKPEMIRRYVAYARRNSVPVMTLEALEKIKAFYLEMRAMSGGTDTVSITLRQNEALMRLAEASAKIQLSPTVRAEDAERAMRIMKVSLQQLGYDQETGKIDIDRAEGGTPSSQRAKINIILDVIDRLEKQLGKGAVAREEVIAEATNEGLKESDTEELLQRLKKEGMIFEPKANFVQKV